MTQLFIGLMDGVRPAVKVLKYNTDEPTTLSNNAYDRFLFNSDNQKLAIVRDQNVETFNYWTNSPTTAGNVWLYGGDSATCKYVGYFTKIYSSANYGYAGFYGRRKNLFPDISYPPIAEARIFYRDEWITSATRNLQWVFDGTGADPRELGVYASYQYASAWCKPEYNSTGLDWVKAMPPSLSFMGSDEWVLKASGGTNGRRANFPESAYFDEGSKDLICITAFWDLPADQTPMASYSHKANVECFRADENGVVMARQGYSVDGSAGTRHRILDSTISLASVVMVGTYDNIAAGQVIEIPSGLNMPMAPTTIVEMMVKESGEAQYIPPHILSGYAKDRRLDLKHKVNPYSITIWNNGTHSVDITYMVFNIDTEPQTTGGVQIMRPVNVNGVEEIQIKKPFSSDAAPKISDIILDTRFPTLQIIDEGFLPIDSFNDDAENPYLLGGRARVVNFQNNGFIPFLKFSAVFEDRIMPPIQSRAYSYSMGGAPSNPNRFSSLARLSNNSVKFWMNPNSWSSLGWNSDRQEPRVEYFGGNPVGIRYYIFGITPK